MYYQTIINDYACTLEGEELENFMKLVDENPGSSFAYINGQFIEKYSTQNKDTVYKNVEGIYNGVGKLIGEYKEPIITAADTGNNTWKPAAKNTEQNNLSEKFLGEYKRKKAFITNFISSSTNEELKNYIKYAEELYGITYIDGIFLVLPTKAPLHDIKFIYMTIKTYHIDVLT